jgi:VWFA-related protein
MPPIPHIRRYAVAALAAAGVIASPVQADGLGLSVQRVDAAQYPTVRAYVSVANSNGVPIVGLDEHAFQVQEDGKPVDGVVVESLVDSQEPIAIAVVVDVSGSMADENKLQAAKEAATAFVDALGPNDRVSIVSFADQVQVVQDYTGDTGALKSAIGGLVARGNTLLYDAVAQTSRRQATQNQRRRALILLTDGQDTKSNASLEDDIAAATTAASPVYPIGLGSDVSRDVLDRMAASTGGQAVYLDNPAQLRSTFLSIGDQLRHRYVLRYTSKLGRDDKPHGLAVQVTYTGQQVTGLGSFTMPSVAPAVVGGLPPSGNVAGVQHVTVDVPGGAQLVQLLVDEQTRGVSRAVPFAFDWDASQETPGPHRVIVRITDPRGASSDQAFSVTVTGPVAASTPAAPTPVPTPEAARPTATPVAFAGPTPGFDAALTLGLLLLLLVAGIAAWFLARPRARSAPAQAGTTQSAIRAHSDMTEVVGEVPAGDLTFVRGGPGPGTPRARLLIARNGEQREIVIDEPEAMLGRDETTQVPIDDPLASRRHCRILRENGTFWLEDMRSLNGTQVNGEPVTRRQLANNDRISIGETVLTFKAEPR